MALEEKKRRYRADGTAIDEKGDRSVVADVALKDEGVVSNAPVSPTQVAEAPKQVEIKPVTPTPAQNPVTVQESQGGVNPEVAEKKVEQRSSNDGVAPPAELGPLVTTVTPINDNAPQLRGGTPVEAQNTDAQAQNISGTPEPQNVGAAQQNVPLFKSDPALLAEYENEVKSWGLNGNVDQLNRPMVSGKDMRKMGWRDFGSPEAQASTATIYTSRWGFNVGGKEHDLVMTPIAADGKVLSPEKLEAYIDYLIANGKTPEGIIALDKRKGNLLVGVDLPNDIEQKIHQAHEKYYLGGGQQNAGTPNGNITTNEGKTPTEETNTTTAPKAEVKETNATPVAEAKEEGATAQVNTAQRNTAMTSDSVGQMNDLFLNQIIEKNVGKDSEAAKKAVQMAREELERRGKPLPPSLTEAPKQETQKAQPKKGELTDEEKKGEEENDLSEEDLEVGIDAIKERLKDENLSAEAKKEYEKRLAEWEHELDSKKKNKSELDELGYWKDTYKDNDDKTLEIMRKALDGLPGEETKIRAIDEILAARHPELQPEPEMKLEDQPNYKDALADRDKKQKELDELLKNKGSYRAVAREEYEKNKKDAGLTDEDEKKVRKRQRTARIIANIGDVLQGFANLAGTWYGANSSKLTSLSGAVGETQERELTMREKRREKLEKNYQDLLAQLKKEGDTDIAQRVAALKTANDRLNKISDNFYTEQGKSKNRIREKKEETVQHGIRQEKTTDETNKRTAYKAQKQQETDNNKSKNRQSEIAAASAGRVHEKRVAGEEARKTKRTPSYSDTHGGKSGNKRKKRRSNGTVHG